MFLVLMLQIIVIFLWTWLTVRFVWAWFEHKPLRIPDALKKKPKVVIPGEDSRLWPRLMPVKKMDKMAWNFRWSGFSLPVNLARQFLLLALVALVFMMFGYYFYAGALILLLAGIVSVLVKQSEKNQKDFISTLPVGVDVIVQSIRAGFPFFEAIEVAGKESKGAVGNAFSSIWRAYTYRMDFSYALELLDKQIDLPEWSMVSDMLLVAEKSGGDVTGILSQVSQTLRDKYEVEEEVLTATASGRASAVIISLLAPGVFAIFYLMSPEYVLPLIQTKLGNFMLIGALILELIGVYIVHRIMKVDF